ncbi:MAG: DUF4116 domain-containing protein [Treponema sp.]|nr:DUF4116 domain-containing protein [Treponema sp.]
MAGEFLFGKYLLKVLQVRVFGKEDAGDGTDGTDRYFAQVIKAPPGSLVKNKDQVSVKFRNNGFRPEGKFKHRYYGEIAVFDGVDNDIQTNPDHKNLDARTRTRCTWRNPFDKKYLAIDSKGNLINPEDVRHGVYICLKCLKIVRWREINDAPQFYHWPRYNPDCPWSSSTGEGGWGGSSASEDIDYDAIWEEVIKNLIENDLLYLLIDQNLDDIPDSIKEKYKDILKGDESPPPPPPPPEPEPAPPPKLNREDYLIMVKNDGLMLNNVPDAYRDREMCEAAVRRNVRALQYVPEELLDRIMLLIALRNKREDLDKYFPDLMDFRKIYELHVNEFGIPETNRDGITGTRPQKRYGD